MKQDIPKSRLQLVGVTALFIAAKLEEIYPPKLSEFSYVTDGACTDDEILIEELVMLKVSTVDRSTLSISGRLAKPIQKSLCYRVDSADFINSPEQYPLRQAKHICLVNRNIISY